jgi:hypothetical protein
MGSFCSSRSCSVQAEALRYSTAFYRISWSPPVAVAAAVAVSAAAAQERENLLGSRSIRRIRHRSQLRLSSFQDRFSVFLQLGGLFDKYVRFKIFKMMQNLCPTKTVLLYSIQYV